LAQVTIEYMIMVPVLILQIFIFPFAAQAIMDTWGNQRINIQLQEMTGHLASTIQQLYYTCNHASIPSGSVTIKLDIPPTILEKKQNAMGGSEYVEYHYNITLQEVPNTSGTAKIMKLTLNFVNVDSSYSTIVTLGDNAYCHNLTVSRDSVSIINATKTAGSIMISFDGDS
jgi:hypothetical protein